MNNTGDFPVCPKVPMILSNKDCQSYPEAAQALFNEGYNCAQAVFAAFSDVTGLDKQTSIMLSSGFGGGMGRLREVCGAVSGMIMAASAICGYTDPKDSVAKKQHYQLVQHLCGHFKQENGSIICRELLGLGNGADDPTPSERTEQYYKRRPCGEYVKIAAQIVCEAFAKE